MEAQEELLDFSDLFLERKPRKVSSQTAQPKPFCKLEAPSTHESITSAAPCLSLNVQFGAPPLVDFSCVSVRTSCTRTLLVKNEGSRAQRFEVRGLSPRDMLRVFPEVVDIPAHGSKILSITWMPRIAAPFSKKLELRLNQSQILQVDVRGVSINPSRNSSVKKPEMAAHGGPQAPQTGVRAPLTPSGVLNQLSAPMVCKASCDACTTPMSTPVDTPFDMFKPTSNRPSARRAPLHFEDSDESNQASPFGSLQQCQLQENQQVPEQLKAKLTQPQEVPHLQLQRQSQRSAQPVKSEPTPLPANTTQTASTPLFTPKKPIARRHRLALGAARQTPASPSSGGESALLAMSTGVPARGHAATSASAISRETERRLSSAVPSGSVLRTTRMPISRGGLGGKGERDMQAGVAAAGFYDADWRERRERGFCTFINFTLSETTTGDGRTEAAFGHGDGGAALGAGERQRLTLRDLEHRRQETLLRRRAAALLHTDLRHVLCRIEEQIESGLLCVRPPLRLDADVGLRDNLLSLLCCYNPLWLRLALETVSGEVAPPGASRDDLCTIRRFADRRVLSLPQAQVARRSAEEARDLAHKLIVRRALCVLLLLDAAKERALLRSDPCLFSPAAAVKSSRAMALEFSRCFLSGGVGDLAKHLATLGAPLKHEQKALHEFDFGVRSLKTDLRDGARLCRLVEFVGGAKQLTSALRLPATNRTTKLRNTELALKAMEAKGVAFGGGGHGGYGARDAHGLADLLVQGHCEATLGVLWSLFSQCALPALAPPELVHKETARARRLALGLGFGDVLAEEDAELDERADAWERGGGGEGAEEAASLLGWVRAVCACYNLRVCNLSTSLRTGRVLCALVHAHVPELLGERNGDELLLAQDTAGRESLEDAASGLASTELSSNARSGSAIADLARLRFAAFRDAAAAIGGVPPLLFSAAATTVAAWSGSARGISAFESAEWEALLLRGPDPCVGALVIACLFSRVVELGRTRQAARTLQMLRRTCKNAQTDGPYARMRLCVKLVPLQRRITAIRAARRELARHKAAAVIGRNVRVMLARRDVRRRREARRAAAAAAHAATRLQAMSRGASAVLRYNAVRAATVHLQATSRMVALRNGYLRTLVAVQRLQASSRGLLRAKLGAKRARASVMLSAFTRRWLAMRALSDALDACERLQAAARGRAARQLRRLNASARKVQSYARTANTMRRYQRIMTKVVQIQADWRRCSGRKGFYRFRIAAIEMQATARMVSAKRVHISKLRSCSLLQSAVRALRAQKDQRIRAAAATRIQSLWRAVLSTVALKVAVAAATHMQACARMRSCAHEFRLQRAAAISLESLARTAYLRRRFVEMRTAAVCVQARCRSRFCRWSFVRIREAITQIAAAWRAHCCRARLAQLIAAATAAQARVRQTAAARLARRLGACRTLQSAARGAFARAALAKAVAAATTVEAAARARAARASIRLAQNAATLIEARARRMCHRRRWTRLGQALEQLQAAVRGYALRREVAKMRALAIVLQAAWRCTVSSRQLRNAIRAAVVMQAAMRRRAAISHYKVHTFSCVTLQSFARRLLAVRVASHHRAQRFVAAFVRGNKQRLMLRRQGSVATLIQAAWRAVRARASLRRSVKAVLHISSVVRRFLALKHCSERRAAAVRLQAGFRCRAAVRRAAFFRCVCRVQAFCRMQQARVHVLRLQISSTCIAAAWRAHAAAAHYKLLLGAAVKVRHSYIAWSTRRRYHRCEVAVLLIQSASRGLSARRCADRHRAAISLQAATRGLLTRGFVQKAQIAATCIQSAWRAVVSTVGLNAAIAAATHVAAAARALLARRRLSMCVRAAVRLQSVGRRCAAERAFSRSVAGAILLQAMARARASQNVLHRSLHAASLISAHTLRLRAQRRRTRCIAAVLVLQSSCRRRAAVRFVGLLKCVNTLQRFWSSRRQKQLFEKLRANATRVAAMARARACRRSYATLHAAVRIIRQNCLAHLARRHLRQICAAALKVQAAARGIASRRYTAVIRASISIQSTTRGFLVRKSGRSAQSAATVIQSVWRAVLSTVALNVAIAAATHIETRARRWAHSRTWHSRRAAVKRIQASARRQRARALCLLLRQQREREAEAVMLLQRIARCRAARRYVSVVRSLAHLANLALLERSARIVQTCARATLDERRRRRMAAVLNDRARATLCARRWRRGRIAVLRLQSIFRGARARACWFARVPALRAVASRAAEAYRRMVADRSLWLSNRTNSALQTLLRSTNLGAVLRAVAALEMFTLIDRLVCVRMVADGAVDAIYRLLATCNRSTPHQCVVVCALRVLLNLGRHVELRVRIWRPDALLTLVDLVQNYRENEDMLAEALGLMHIFAHHEETRKMLQASSAYGDCVKRLEGVTTLLQRKHQQHVRPAVRATAAAVKVTKSAAAPRASTAVTRRPVCKVEAGRKAAVTAGSAIRAIEAKGALRQSLSTPFKTPAKAQPAVPPATPTARGCRSGDSVAPRSVGGKQAVGSAMKSAVRGAVLNGDCKGGGKRNSPVSSLQKLEHVVAMIKERGEPAA